MTCTSGHATFIVFPPPFNINLHPLEMSRFRCQQDGPVLPVWSKRTERRQNFEKRMENKAYTPDLEMENFVHMHPSASRASTHVSPKQGGKQTSAYPSVHFNTHFIPYSFWKSFTIHAVKSLWISFSRNAFLFIEAFCGSHIPSNSRHR